MDVHLHVSGFRALTSKYLEAQVASGVVFDFKTLEQKSKNS